MKKALALALLPVMTAAGIAYANHQMSPSEKAPDMSGVKTEQQVDKVTYDDYVEYSQVTGEPMSQEGAREFAETYDKESFEETMDAYIDNGRSEDNSYRSDR